MNVDGVKVSEGEKVIRPIVNYAVCEEITGTWCAWCVKGIATFERLDALYPDSFMITRNRYIHTVMPPDCLSHT